MSTAPAHDISNRATITRETAQLNKTILLSAENLVKRFPVKAGGFSTSKLYVHALNSVSFDIYENSTLGIVGESGSGKTTAARTILRIHDADSGKLFFDLPRPALHRGIHAPVPDATPCAILRHPVAAQEATSMLHSMSQNQMQEMQDKDNFFKYDKEKLKTERTKMQYIFQNPYMALNPKMQIKDIIIEPLLATGKKLSSNERLDYYIFYFHFWIKRHIRILKNILHFSAFCF
jgi:peptide/nickel transport system ATP-binding protein